MHASFFSTPPTISTTVEMIFAPIGIFALWKCYKIYDAFHFLILLVSILLFAFISVVQQQQLWKREHMISNNMMVYVLVYIQRRQLFSTNYAFPINSRRTIFESIQNRTEAIYSIPIYYMYLSVSIWVRLSARKFSHSKNKSISFEFYR